MDGERAEVFMRVRSARLRLVRILLLAMLPPGAEAYGLAVRLGQFLEETKLSTSLLDALIRHLNRDHPTLKEPA